MPNTLQPSRQITPGVWLIASALSLFLGSGFLLLQRSRPVAPSRCPAYYDRGPLDRRASG